MEFLGNGKKLRGAAQDPPVDRYADIVQKRDQRIQHLRHTTAIISGVDVKDSQPIQIFGHFHNVGNHLVSDDASVFIDCAHGQPP